MTWHGFGDFGQNDPNKGNSNLSTSKRIGLLWFVIGSNHTYGALLEYIHIQKFNSMSLHESVLLVKEIVFFVSLTNIRDFRILQCSCWVWSGFCTELLIKTNKTLTVNKRISDREVLLFLSIEKVVGNESSLFYQKILLFYHNIYTNSKCLKLMG